MEPLIILFAIFWGAPIIVAGILGERRNRPGWPFGLLLGWVGVLIIYCMRPAPSNVELQVRELEAQQRLRELGAQESQPRSFRLTR